MPDAAAEKCLCGIRTADVVKAHDEMATLRARMPHGIAEINRAFSAASSLPELIRTAGEACGLEAEKVRGFSAKALDSGDIGLRGDAQGFDTRMLGAAVDAFLQELRDCAAGHPMVSGLPVAIPDFIRATRGFAP